MSPFARDVRRFWIVAVVVFLVVAGAWWISEEATRMQSTTGASRPEPSRAAPTPMESPAELELQGPRLIGRRPVEVANAMNAPSPARERIGGRVEDQAGRPLANVRIDLVRPAAVDDRPACEILEHDALVYPDVQLISRRVLRSVESDARGGFRFDSVRPGHYVLRAVRPPGLTQLFEDISLTHGQSRDDVLLRFFADGWLRCRVHGPASFSGWKDLWIIAAIPVEPSQKGATFAWPSAWASTRLTGPGDFVVGPLASGIATVMLCWAGPPGRHGVPQPPDEISAPHSVGTIDMVEARESFFEFDATPLLPAYVVLQARREGELVSGVGFTLARVGTNVSEHLDDFWREGNQSRFGPLTPGRWRVVLRNSWPKPWTLQIPRLLELAPGAEEYVSIDLEVYGHTLRIRRPGSLDPLGHRWVDIVPLGLESIETSGMSLFTTKDGCVEATLPPGSYFVCRQRSGQTRPIEETEGARVEWTAFGLSPAEIELR